jgi:hypothetical protein
VERSKDPFGALPSGIRGLARVMIWVSRSIAVSMLVGGAINLAVGLVTTDRARLGWGAVGRFLGRCSSAIAFGPREAT